MKKVLLFGATGNLGKEIAKELVKQGYETCSVVRNKTKGEEMAPITGSYVIANVADPASLKEICKDFDIVVSALGKSVSPNDRSKPSFNDIDLVANTHILNEAKNSGVKKFIYVSALHSEKFSYLEYFRVHHEFSEILIRSGLNYSIIKPPAIFSAYADMMDMARKGRLVNIGSGDKRTNPIYEGDLAKVCVNAIKENNFIVEAGGKNVYTRKQLNQIIQKETDPGKKVRTVPLGLFKLSLPAIKLFDRNMYDKFAFFTAVIEEDLLAPPLGEKKFEDYIREKSKN